MALGGWGDAGKVPSPLWSPLLLRVLGLFLLGKRNGDKYTAKWKDGQGFGLTQRRKGFGSPNPWLEVGIGRQCSLMANAQALELDRLRASPADDGQLLTICIEQVASLF